MAIEQRIDDMIRPTMHGMGYELVLITLGDVQGRRTLQIMAEKSDGSQINVDDCADISHLVSALLDVEDPIQGAYHLEVSSPGIDRPLVKPQDFKTYAGFDAKLETHIPINGRKRYKGQLLEPQDGQVRIMIDGQTYSLAHRDIAHAKLVLTDALLDAYKQNKINH